MEEKNKILESINSELCRIKASITRNGNKYVENDRNHSQIKYLKRKAAIYEPSLDDR